MLATLHDDGVWRNRGGLPVEAIEIPAVVAAARPDPDKMAAQLRGEADHWHAAALRAVEAMARTRELFTTEDVVAELPPPRDPRAAHSRLMVDARRCGLIALTDEDQAGTRRQSGGRRKRIWRSLVHSASPEDGQLQLDPQHSRAQTS